MNSLLNKAIAQERLTPAEGLEILKNAPWTEVVEAADTVRKAKLPGNRVGYTAFRIVNYTNVCEVTCSFCSFCRPAKHPEAYILSLDEIRQKTIEAKAKGADQIFLQGGVNKEIPLSYYTDVLKMLTQELGPTRFFCKVASTRKFRSAITPMSSRCSRKNWASRCADSRRLNLSASRNSTG